VVTMFWQQRRAVLPPALPRDQDGTNNDNEIHPDI
jgi:hypothetical protein